MAPIIATHTTTRSCMGYAPPDIPSHTPAARFLPTADADGVSASATHRTREISWKAREQEKEMRGVYSGSAVPWAGPSTAPLERGLTDAWPGSGRLRVARKPERLLVPRSARRRRQRVSAVLSAYALGRRRPGLTRCAAISDCTSFPSHSWTRSKAS